MIIATMSGQDTSAHAAIRSCRWLVLRSAGFVSGHSAIGSLLSPECHLNHHCSCEQSPAEPREPGTSILGPPDEVERKNERRNRVPEVACPPSRNELLGRLLKETTYPVERQDAEPACHKPVEPI